MSIKRNLHLNGHVGPNDAMSREQMVTSRVLSVVSFGIIVGKDDSDVEDIILAPNARVYAYRLPR